MNKGPRACVVDINAVAIYMLVKSDPGIKRSRLYKGRHGKEIFDRMVEHHMISVEGDGSCTLTERGVLMGECLHTLIVAFEEEELVGEYIAGLIDWYQDKIDANRERNRIEIPETEEEVAVEP